MNGNIGIVGTPVIDKARGVLYVVALTQAGPIGPGVAPATGFIQRLHALDLATGADLPESPVTITTDSFVPRHAEPAPRAPARQRHGLHRPTPRTATASPTTASSWPTTRSTLAQVAVFNASPTGTEAGIWQTGQGPAADAEGNVYVGTGNGSWDGVSNFSESVLKFSPQLKMLDWFTPTNHVELDRTDTDMNSSGPTLIPGTHLLIAGGKEGVLYSLDTRNLGHLGDEHAVQHFRATTSHMHNTIYWQSAKRGDLLYIWGQRDKAKVYKFDGDQLTETPVESRDIPNEGHPGAMLSLSANGARDGILWAAIHATGDSWHESRPGVLHAYDADDIRVELWNSLELPDRDDCGEYSKMAPPTIANGHVYLASFGTQNIGTGQFCVYGLLPTPGAAAPAAPTGVTDGNHPLRPHPHLGRRPRRRLLPRGPHQHPRRQPAPRDRHRRHRPHHPHLHRPPARPRRVRHLHRLRRRPQRRQPRLHPRHRRRPPPHPPGGVASYAEGLIRSMNCRTVRIATPSYTPSFSR